MDMPTTAATSANVPACVINCAVYRDGMRQDIPLEQVSDVLAKDDGSFVWVGLYEPDEHLLDELQEEFGLHDLSIEDAHNAHQRAKLEVFGNTLFMAVHTAQMVDKHLRFGETHVFYGPRFLLTVRHGASLSFAAARQKLEREPELLKIGPAVALHGVLDFIVDNYEPIVDAFSQELDSLEHAIFAEDFSRGTIQRLYTLRKELTKMRVAVMPMQDLLKQLVRIQDFGIPDEVRPYFRDIADHAARTADIIDVQREMAATAMNTNLSLVTINQGEVVKKLAGWAGLLAVPTLVASWYGMNFHGMPELDKTYAYPILIGVVSVSCIVLYRYLKKVHWL